jgi:phage terminase large subunit
MASTASIEPVTFDWKNPDYDEVIRERNSWIKKLRANPGMVPGLKAFYRDNPGQFISDWGWTVDPRNVERGLPSRMPFLLFPRQLEWIDFLMRKWRAGEPGLTEKSRDSGVSWLAIAFSCTMCLFHEGMGVGFGSRKEEYVDKLGDPKSLFYKARVFLGELPTEFRGGWDAKVHAPHLRIHIPTTGSTITGEAGDNIGRGDRASFYFVDEAAFLDRPKLVDASLSQTTNCRQDISTPNGMANSFAERVRGGRIEVFRFHWRDDPRKDDAWYAKQKAELDPVTVAQEIDIDYAASVEGVLIPSAWVQAATDAHEKLGIAVTGQRRGALDVADEGRDKNAFVIGHGILVEHIEDWSGKGDDIFGTVQKAFDLCDEHDLDEFDYDSDGLGAGVRGDARVVNERRVDQGRPVIGVNPYRGSQAVLDPEREDVPKRKNKDFFLNRKAQSWWRLRTRFQMTYRAVVTGAEYDPEEIISISSKCGMLSALQGELSQPTYSINATGKVVIDKAPDGSRSPNLADCVVIRYGAARRPMIITDELLGAI